MQMRNEEEAVSLEDQLVAATAGIAPQFRHLLLDLALQLGKRHPNVAIKAQPALRLVQS